MTENTGTNGNVSNDNHKNNGNDSRDESELDDLEMSLRALEKLDRSSPDLWPDHIPGVNQFLPVTPGTNASSPAAQGEKQSSNDFHLI